MGPAEGAPTPCANPGAAAATLVRVPALTPEARRRAAAPAPAPDGAPWTYAEQEGLGVLRMPTWVLYKSSWDGRRFLDELARGLVARRVPALVVDLRENEGGNDAGNDLLAHLIDAPLALPAYRRHVRYRAAPAELRPLLSTWDKSFFDWGAAAQGPVDGRLYRLTRWDDEASGADVLRPAAPRYRGRVFVLVSAVNSSATFQFALAVKERGLGTLVGQPTGGNRRGINGSAFFFVKLPRTGLEVDLPLVAAFPAAPQPDAGVEPDVLVRPTLAQIAAGEDAELAAVRALLRDRSTPAPR